MTEKPKQSEKGNPDQSKDPYLNFSKSGVNFQRNHKRKFTRTKGFDVLFVCSK